MKLHVVFRMNVSCDPAIRALWELVIAANFGHVDDFRLFTLLEDMYFR